MANKQYVALDVGSSNIKIVYGGVKNKTIEVNEYEVIPTPDNCIRDGKITNAVALSGAISEVINKYNIKEKNLIMNATGTGVITRDIQIPKSSEEEIEKILEFEAQQYFPVDLESYALDYKIIEDINEESGAFSNILLVAVPSKQVEDYMQIPEILKMNMAAIDVNANCIFKILYGKDVDAGIHGDFAVVDVGEQNTGITIFGGGKLRFNRFIINGSIEIDKAIAQAYNMDIKKAEEEKKKIGRIMVEDAELSEVDEVLGIHEIIKPPAENILADVSRFFEFYKTRSSKNRLEKIYICGGGSKLSGYDKYMSSYFNIPVEYLETQKNITYKGTKTKEQFAKDFVFLVSGIGALVR